MEGMDPTLRWKRVAKRLRATSSKEGQREKQISVLLKTPNWYKSLRGHGEQLRPTTSAQGAAGWAPTPSTPEAGEGDTPTPGTGGQGTGRYRHVRGALAAPPAEQGQLSSPPGVALPLARAMGAGVAWAGCLSCSNSLLPSTVAPWGQKELALGQFPCGDGWGSAASTPSAHLHGPEGLLGLCLPTEVDEGTAAPWEQPHRADLPEPGGHRPPNVGEQQLEIPKWGEGGLETPQSCRVGGLVRDSQTCKAGLATPKRWGRMKDSQNWRDVEWGNRLPNLRRNS